MAAGPEYQFKRLSVFDAPKLEVDKKRVPLDVGRKLQHTRLRLQGDKNVFLNVFRKHSLITGIRVTLQGVYVSDHIHRSAGPVPFKVYAVEFANTRLMGLVKEHIAQAGKAMDVEWVMREAEYKLFEDGDFWTATQTIFRLELADNGRLSEPLIIGSEFVARNFQPLVETRDNRQQSGGGGPVRAGTVGKQRPRIACQGEASSRKFPEHRLPVDIEAAVSIMFGEDPNVKKKRDRGFKPKHLPQVTDTYKSEGTGNGMIVRRDAANKFYLDYCQCGDCFPNFIYQFINHCADNVTLVIHNNQFSRRLPPGVTDLNLEEILLQGGANEDGHIVYDVILTEMVAKDELTEMVANDELNVFITRSTFYHKPCKKIEPDVIGVRVPDEGVFDTESRYEPELQRELQVYMAGGAEYAGASSATNMEGVSSSTHTRAVSSACGWSCAVAIDEEAEPLAARINALLCATRYATSIISVDILFAYLDLGVLLPNVCEAFFAARDLFDPTFTVNGRLQELIRRYRGTAAPVEAANVTTSAATPAGAAVTAPGKSEAAAGPAADDGAAHGPLTWMMIRDAVYEAERTGVRLHETILRHVTRLPPVDSLDMQGFLNAMGHEFHKYIPQWEELMEFDRRSPAPTLFAFNILEHAASPANTMDEASYALAEALINMMVASQGGTELRDRLVDGENDAEDSNDDEPESWVGLIDTVVEEGNAAFLRCFLTHDETREVAEDEILNVSRLELLSAAVSQLNNVYGADDEEMPHLAIVKLLLETIVRDAPEGVASESELGEVKRAFQHAAFEALDNWDDLDELVDDLWEYLITHPCMDLTLDGDALWDRVLVDNRAQAMVALMHARASRGLPDITAHVAELAFEQGLWVTWRALKQPPSTSVIRHALTNWREQDAESVRVQMLMFLDCGFDFNATINEDGETLLHALCDHEFLLPALLACGADPSKRDRNGRTPAERLAATMASPPVAFTALLTSQVDLAPHRSALLRAATHLCYDRAVAFLSDRVDWSELPAEPVMGPGSAPLPLLLLPLHNFKPADGPIAHVQRVRTFATLMRRGAAIDPVALQRNQAAIQAEYRVEFVEPVSVTYERVLNEGTLAPAWRPSNHRLEFSRPFRGRVRALFVLYQGNSLLAQLPLELLFALLEVLATLEHTLPPPQPLTTQDRQQWLTRTECLLYERPTMSQRALKNTATGLVRNLVDQICPAATTSEVQRVRDFLSTGPAAVKPVDARLPPTVTAAAPQPSEPQQPSTTGGDTAAPSAGVTAGATDGVGGKPATLHVEPLRLRMQRVHAFVNQVVEKVSGVGDADAVRAILNAEWTAALDIDVTLLAETAA